jgi:hypothetical protein
MAYNAETIEWDCDGQASESGVWGCETAFSKHMITP